MSVVNDHGAEDVGRLVALNSNQKKFLSLLTKHGVSPFVNVYRQQDVIANAESITYGVPPFYNNVEIGRLQNGLIPAVFLSNYNDKEVFLIKSATHVGAILINHATKTVHEYEAVPNLKDYPFVLGYSVIRHNSLWTSYRQLFAWAPHIAQVYPWFLLDKSRSKIIPGLVEAFEDKESRGNLGYCAVYSQVIIAWFILFSSCNFVDYVLAHRNEILEQLYGPGKFDEAETDKRIDTALDALVMTTLMHNATTLLATENRKRMSAKVPDMPTFLESLGLSTFEDELGELDIETLAKAGDEALMEVGLNKGNIKAIQQAAGDLNLTDTPVLVHLFNNII